MDRIVILGIVAVGVFVSRAAGTGFRPVADRPRNFPSQDKIRIECLKLDSSPQAIVRLSTVAVNSNEGAAVLNALELAKPGVVALLRNPDASNRPRSGNVHKIWKVTRWGGVGTRDIRKPDFKGQTNSLATYNGCYVAQLDKGYRYVSVMESDKWGEAPRFSPGKTLPTQ